MGHNELIIFFFGIGIMLILSRILAELGRRYSMPVVMGELLVGILLGPTVLGEIAPSINHYFFPLTGNIPIAMQGITRIAVVMLLFVAGMEVQLPLVLKQGRVAITTSLSSMVIPFVIGFAVAWLFPHFFAEEGLHDKLTFALFMGTALSISALPVIARILMDLNLFRTKIGMIIIASAMFDDLIGWLIFSFILGMMNSGAEHINPLYTLALIVGYGLFMLTIGKKIIDKTLPWMQNKLSWPGGVLACCLGFCFLGGAFTEYIGIHAVLGAFIMGIAFGDSVHLHEKAREIIHQFVTNIFAPLFFVSIGLKVNFYNNFNLWLVVFVIVLAYVGKVVGGSIGAYMGGMNKRESLAVGFGMNARGAMEIILGTLALNAGLIGKQVFVALVIMALVTSLTAGPLMKRFIDSK